MALGATLQQWMAAHPNQGTISAYHPTLSDRIESGLSGLLSRFGHSQWDANRLASKISNAVQAVTPVGSATAADQSRRDFKQGHYASGLGNAVSAVLGVLPDGGATAAKGLGAVLHSIIAPLYHGSPHAFEKFALEKIGTGEGAQSYGHGLYFAENPAVAKQYQQNISGNAVKLSNGDLISANGMPFSTPEQQAKRWAIQLLADHGSVAAAKSRARGSANVISELDRLGQAGAVPAGDGHLYEVSLDANPEDFLNLDAPIAEQSSQFGKAARNYYSDWTKRELRPQLNDMSKLPAIDWLRKYPGLQSPYFANHMSEAGVPGYRYLDQGSRGAGQGTHNYVVFNPSIIDILSRQ